MSTGRVSISLLATESGFHNSLPFRSLSWRRGSESNLQVPSNGGMCPISGLRQRLFATPPSMLFTIQRWKFGWKLNLNDDTILSSVVLPIWTACWENHQLTFMKTGKEKNPHGNIHRQQLFYWEGRFVGQKERQTQGFQRRSCERMSFAIAEQLGKWSLGQIASIS